MGGDEFTILLEGLRQQNDLEQICQKIEQTFEAPFLIDGHSLNTHTSIGIAIYPDDATDSETLLKMADAAMYQAKNSETFGYCYYHKPF